MVQFPFIFKFIIKSAVWELSYIVLLSLTLKCSCVLALQKEEYAHMLAVKYIAVLRGLHLDASHIINSSSFALKFGGFKH